MPEMTSRERLLAAYRHAEVDRVPCSPRIWAWLLEFYGSADLPAFLRAREEFGFDPTFMLSPFTYVSALACADSYPLPQVEYRKKEWAEDEYRMVRRTFKTPAGTLTDVTKFPPAGRREYGIAPNPARIEHLVKGRSDLAALRYLVPDKTITGDFAKVREYEALMGDQGLCLVSICSSLCHRAGDVFPMPELMMAYYDDRKFFDELLGIFQKEMLAEAEACIEAGFKHYFANWYYNSLSTGWSPAIWKEVFAPQLTELTALIHRAGGTVNFYDDGKCMPLLELFAGCGIDVLQTLTPPPVGDVDLAEAKQRIGKRVCLMGSVDTIYVIERGTPELIDQTVKRAIQAGAPGGGFILGTSDSIRDGTPLQNVKAYFSAALKYGARVK